MQPLIDGDILLHELGWSGEFKDKETGEDTLLPFSTVQELLDNKIADICGQVGATQPPIIFLTADPYIVKMAKVWGYEHEYEKGFRYNVAVTQPYKGTRKNPKPFHFYNIAAYLLSEYDTRVSYNGHEADDMMVIEQLSSDKATIICSRDKDLRIAEGWHYSWECGRSRELGPHKTDRVGKLIQDGKKIIGYGQKFFYYQMLIGDSADHIPGLKGYGPVKAYKILKDLTNEYDLYTAVKVEYKKMMKDQAKDYFFEQANLLWMREQVDKEYTPRYER